MSDVQIAVIDQQDTQIVLAVPGVQGATGSSIPAGGTADQVLRKNSSTDYDANWTQVTSAMIADGTIVNADVNAGAAIAGTKISPDFGGQAVTTTGQINGARVNVTGNTAPTNGIYLPAANSVALSTNGTGRLFVDASGNISAGNSTAFGPLDIKTSAGKRIVYTSLADYASNGIIGLTDGGNETDLGIGGNNLRFFTAATERLRITSAGLVGIGTSDPQRPLDVVSNSSAETVTFRGASANNISTLRFNSNNAATNYASIQSRPTFFELATASGIPLLLSPGSGTGVGIGTSSANTILHVNAGAAADTNVRLQIGAAGNHAKHTYSDSTNTVQWTAGWRSSTNTFGINVGDSFNSTGLTIDSSGRVGIGTTSPGTTLDVAGTIRANTAVVTSLTNGILQSREFGGNSANNTIEYSIRPATGKSGYLTFTEDAVADRWSIGIQNGSDALRFISGTPTTGTERARIDSSGRLLVGASTARTNFYNLPSTFSPQLQVESAGTTTLASLSIVNNVASESYGSALILSKSRGGSVGSNVILLNNDEVGSVLFQGNDGSEFVQVASISAQIDGETGANDMPGRLVFSTTADGASSPTERMRITQGGNVFVGNVTGDYNTLGISLFSNGNLQAVTNQIPTLVLNRKGSDGVIVDFYRDTNNPGTISVTTTATSYNTSSDYRLKQNVTPVTDGINRLQQLKPSRFNFIADPTKTVDGFLAHEVQTIVPEAITGEKDAVDDDGNPQYQGIDQSKLVPLLTAALQEAIAKIETLEAKVAALEGA